jgi:ABC-type transport system involved in cytochrome bd biosynthesis fused ATPase/permease subunit
MQPLPRSATASPLAIRISFTAHYSLETCKDRLLNIQVTPSKLMSMLGGAYLKFRFSSINADLYEFGAERRVTKTVVNARGYLQKIDEEVTEIVGYADAKRSFYAVLLLLLAIGLLTAVGIYNGTLDGFYVSAALVFMFLASTVANALIVRRYAKQLARIIEETLRNNQQAAMQS